MYTTLRYVDWRVIWKRLNCVDVELYDDTEGTLAEFYTTRKNTRRVADTPITSRETLVLLRDVRLGRERRSEVQKSEHHNISVYTNVCCTNLTNHHYSQNEG